MLRTGMIAVLLAAAFMAGCGGGTKSGGAPLSRSATEARKSELLTTIGGRYENPEAHYELGKIYHQEGLVDRAE